MKKLYSFILGLVMLTSIVHAEMYDRIFVILNDDIITLNEFRESYYKLKSDLLRTSQPMPKDAKKLVFENIIDLSKVGKLLG